MKPLFEIFNRREKKSWAGLASGFTGWALLAPLFLALTAVGQTVAPQRVIQVVMDDDYPPFVFKNRRGKPQGIVVDQWRLWEKQTGIKVKIHALDWDEAMRRMQAGEFDVIDTIFKTDARTAYLDFTPPYARLEVPIFFREGISGITDLGSLKGFPVAAKTGDAAVTLLQKNKVAPLLLYTNYEAIIMAANENKVNVFVVDEPPALYYLHKLNLAGDFRMTAPVNVGEFHRAVHKGDTNLLNQIEAGFAAVGEARLKAIDQKWYGRELNSYPNLRILIYVVIGIGVLLVLLLGWNRALARQVKHHTRALRESEERWNFALLGAGDGVWDLQVPTQAVQYSKRWKEMLGYDEREIADRFESWAGLVHPDDLAQAEADFQAYVEGRTSAYINEHRLRGKDGQYHWILARGKAVSRDAAGKPVRMVGTHSDITERKRAEDVIRKYATIFQSASWGMAIADPETHQLLHVNPALAQMHGYTEEEMTGMNMADLFAPESLAELPAHVRTAHEKGRHTYESRHRRKDGSQFPCRTDVTALKDATGRVLFRAATLEDITERKRAEQRLAAFATLGRRLNAAPDVEAAARVIVDIADKLFGWDACKLDFYDSKTDICQSLLTIDIVEGQRRDVVPSYLGEPPSPRMRRVLRDGPLLILRENPAVDANEIIPFGDVARPSASLMFTPITEGSVVIGALSIQSYRLHAYTPDDLKALQDLTDHCAGALERLRGRDALRASEANHRTLVESAADGILTSDAQARLLDANTAACRMFGYTREEFMTMRIASVVTEAEAIRIAPEIARLVVGETVHSEWQCRRKDGTLFPVEVGATVLPDGRLLGILRDITERKLAEQHIKQLNRTYAVLSEINQLIVRERDSQKLLHEACLIAVARGGFKMTWIGLLDKSGKRADITAHAGASADTLKKLDGIINSAPPDAGCDFTRHSLTLGEHAVCNDIENDPRAACWRDAALRREYRSMVALPLKVGAKLVGTFNLYSAEPDFFDTFEMRLLDELATDIGFALGLSQREREHAQLEEQLRQSQKMDAIGQLAGGVAHDFNNILAAIMIQTELSGMMPGLPAEIQDGLQQIRAAAERAANLTRQLLLFSRKQVMLSRELDLNEQVSSLTKMLQRIIGEDVRLQLHLSPVPLMTRADAGMLDQVLMNLAVNARDAMPGGGRLLIETAEKTVDAELASQHPDAAPGRYVQLSVSDTGQGILPEVMPHIFEPFFTTKEAGKGTGLGLATVFGIVKQHRGWFNVFSEPGQGTNFQVFLPASAATSIKAARGEIRPKPRGGTETILLVEDEPSVRRLTRSVLERAGYQVLEASHGREAMKLWEQHRDTIQLLLTDIVMPEGITGRELAAQLRAQQPKLRVVFTSGYSADIAGRELSLQEGQNFVQKPSTPDQILETVRRCLDA